MKYVMSFADAVYMNKLGCRVSCGGNIFTHIDNNGHGVVLKTAYNKDGSVRGVTQSKVVLPSHYMLNADWITYRK